MRDPRIVLEQIAFDLKAPPHVRVSAARALLASARLGKRDPQELSEAATERAIKLLDGRHQ